ncbi:hypothetical protein GBA52_022160 [Prunus armeniaca]|nr:hypothetical protein GBA52_022160 [Prunus armeniaca]
MPEATGPVIYPIVYANNDLPPSTLDLNANEGSRIRNMPFASGFLAPTNHRKVRYLPTRKTRHLISTAL